MHIYSALHSSTKLPSHFTILCTQNNNCMNIFSFVWFLLPPPQTTKRELCVKKFQEDLPSKPISSLLKRMLITEFTAY